MPSGGGRYYGVFLHDEETGISIEQQAKMANLLPEQIIRESVELRRKTVLDKTARAEVEELLSEELKHANNWQQVVTICAESRSKLLNAVKDWTEVEKQRLVHLLTAFLIEHTNHRIESLYWVPQRLLLMALQRSRLLHPRYFAA